jgi:hypothetical protein
LARAWSRKSSRRLKPPFVIGDLQFVIENSNSLGSNYKLQITNYKSKRVSGQQCCSKKDLVIAKQGVARLEIRALSGARGDDLVALETWPSDSEIASSKTKS